MTMPIAPLVLNETSGETMWTASTVQHLRDTGLAFDPTSGPGLENYIERLLADSFSRVSTFWHYAAR